jgi:cytoskeleton protein RodZ
MTTEQHDQPRPETATPDSPGQLLSMAREARGLTQPEVASRLNLRVSLVRDIEEDRFDQRTASTFTRGYLKTYAKLVGASEERVVAAYEHLGLSEVKYAEMHSFSGRTRLEANENRMRLGSWLLFFALGAGALYWILGRPAEKPAVVTMDEQALLEAAGQPATDESNANPVGERNELTIAPAQGDTTRVQPAASAATVAITVSAAQAATPVVQAPVADDMTSGAAQTTAVTAAAGHEAVSPAVAPAEAATPVEADALVISYSGNCWLEVTDASGKKVLSATRHAGQRDVLKGKAPFKLNIGAPKYVTVSFMGQAVDMQRFPVGRPARFELPLKN